MSPRFGPSHVVVDVAQSRQAASRYGGRATVLTDDTSLGHQDDIRTRREQVEVCER